MWAVASNHLSHIMKLEDITIGQAREIAALFGKLNPPATTEAQSHPYAVGANYLIRTVTMTYTGNLVEVGDKELVLLDAAWIADSGRWADAVAKGTFSEVEPYPDGKRVIIGRGAILDAVEITTIPRSQK